MVMSAGQLDMGKALLVLRALELLLKLGNALPGFYGRRTGHSAQQRLWVDLLALSLVCGSHGVTSFNNAQF
jgi:hypothetical protein